MILDENLRRVELYGDGYGCVEYIDHMGSDQRIIDAARVSFSGDRSEWRDEKDPALLRYLLKNGHMSPFEHCQITWHVAVPLFVRSQWHRHRTQSYNEVSRRYTDEDLRFYTPSNLRRQAQKNKQASVIDGQTFNPDVRFYAFDFEPLVPAVDVVAQASYETQRVYERLLAAGVAREMARMVLSQNLYTRFYTSVNLRNAMAFVKERDHEHSQWEIQVAARAMRQHLNVLFPHAMDAWAGVAQG